MRNFANSLRQRSRGGLRPNKGATMSSRRGDELQLNVNVRRYLGSWGVAGLNALPDKLVNEKEVRGQGRKKYTLGLR